MPARRTLYCLLRASHLLAICWMLGVSVTASHAATAAGPYDQLMARLAEQKQTGRLRVTEVGRSGNGRVIPLVAIRPIATRALPRTRILIICAQHGDEPASAHAALELIQRSAANDKPEALLSPHTRRLLGGKLAGLKDVLWLIVPVANPDGYNAGKRLNGAGQDLNRDWQRATQPETRAVRGVFDTWKPNLVLDLHQWSPDDPPPADNGLEMVLRPESPVQQRLERHIAVSALRAVTSTDRRASLVTASPRSTPTLAHRYFAAQGVAAFLIETAARDTQAQRKALLTDMILVLSNVCASVPADTRAAAFRNSGEFIYPREFASWLRGQQPTQPGRDTGRTLVAAGVAAGFWALLSALHLKSRPTFLATSDEILSEGQT